MRRRSLTVSEALTRRPELRERMEGKVLENNLSWVPWVIMPDGTRKTFPGLDWGATSQWGHMQGMFVTNNDGVPLYDRPSFKFQGFVFAPVYALDPDTGELCFGVSYEERPGVRNPYNEDEPAIFCNIGAAGLLDDEGETVVETAIREVYEELGIPRSFVVQTYHASSDQPCFVDPSLSTSRGDLILVEVEHPKLWSKKPGNQGVDDEGEVFHGMEFLPMRELFRRMRLGYENGVFYTQLPLIAGVSFILAHIGYDKRILVERKPFSFGSWALGKAKQFFTNPLSWLALYGLAHFAVK